MIDPKQKLEETNAAIRALEDAGIAVPPEAFEIQELAMMAVQSMNDYRKACISVLPAWVAALTSRWRETGYGDAEVIPEAVERAQKTAARLIDQLEQEGN